MNFVIYSGTGYLNECNAYNTNGGHHSLSENAKHPVNNGPILSISIIVKAVMVSASKAKPSTLYAYTCKGMKKQDILAEMGHPQLPTPIQTDNSTSKSIINTHVQPKHTKENGMWFHCLSNHSVNQIFVLLKTGSYPAAKPSPSNRKKSSLH